jgi:hypothetical protein
MAPPKKLPTKCRISWCDQQAAIGRKGWCSLHYQKWRRHGDPERVVIIRQHPDVCTLEGCDEPYYARHYCKTHYRRWKAHGDPHIVLASHPGASWISTEGYRFLYRPEHPNASRKGTIAEHRLVMAEKLGRPLLLGETVHHCNGDKLDNRPENVALRVGRHGKGADVDALVEWAREVLRRYDSDDSPVGPRPHMRGG